MAIAGYRAATLTGWGRWPRGESSLDRPEWPAQLPPPWPQGARVIARGKGASYGDQAMNTDHLVLLMTSLDRLLAWDPKAGILHAEAGLTLDEVLRFVVPRGFFLPVTPGTSYVTVGGAIAANVHGKNHHAAGCFGDHVHGMDLLTASGEVLHCSPEENRELFETTCGGMGLTGVILDVRLRLVPIESSRVKVSYCPFRTLEEARDIFLAGDREYPFTVAWMNQGCEKGVATLGRFARRGEVEGGPLLPVHSTRSLTVPCEMPRLFAWAALNRLSMSLLYRLYYRLQAGKGTRLEEYKKFFYPLDGIKEWNRVYGPRGFTQYQVVVPLETGIATLREITGLLRGKGIRPCPAVRTVSTSAPVSTSTPASRARAASASGMACIPAAGTPIAPLLMARKVYSNTCFEVERLRSRVIPP